jgi:uncharacterized UBP type Zn finger protein
MSVCSHLDQIRPVSPRTPEGCQECLKTGSYWVHLRLCLECGHVGCCDQSPGKHATRHFHRTSHPIMRSFEPGESWGWCYVDEVMLDDVRQWIRHRARASLEVDVQNDLADDVSFFDLVMGCSHVLK